MNDCRHVVFEGMITSNSDVNLIQVAHVKAAAPDQSVL